MHSSLKRKVPTLLGVCCCVSLSLLFVHFFSLLFLRWTFRSCVRVLVLFVLHFSGDISHCVSGKLRLFDVGTVENSSYLVVVITVGGVHVLKCARARARVCVCVCLCATE